MNAWLNEHILQILAIVVGLGFRHGVGMFTAAAGSAPPGGRGNNPGSGGGGGGKWNKGRIIKFIALALTFAAGCLTAYGMYPLVQWLVGWGSGFAGWISVIFGVLTLAAGWHSLHGLIGLVHDMTDGTPDDEAFDAAFWIPTTLPLGWAALIGLFANPRSIAGTAAAVIAVSIVSAHFTHKILKKVHQAKGHHTIWMIVGTIVCAFVGFVHIPALAYLVQFADQYLPPWAATTFKVSLVAAGFLFCLVALGELFAKNINKYTQWACMYSIPVFTVLAVTWFQVTDSAQESMNLVFSSFRS